ncbi:hypothetical protein NM688_g8600 [Phlebia brevispora]|uniref:Uncharacterized protein n=1 Tax=Phlebia brevispora TaxID=194682 RepID=A0ACC1RR79_9APHY|nr:hypothetical protein NM688_g8600 [Phlebia brevispora]
MSVLPAAKRSLRIIALPLTAASRTLDAYGSSHLTYYHFITPPREKKGTDWVQWISTKSAKLWAGFGKAPEGHWKRRTYLYGERLIDRIDFEELALKSLDPSLGPKISHFGQSNAKVKAEDHPTIPLIYPSTVCSSPLEHLRTLLAKRTPRHRRGFYMWMIIAPLTAPFMIIPIIPNLPFFFCVWRSWSHYRAYQASSYLEKVLSRGAIIPQPSQELDAIYAKYAPPLLPQGSAGRPEESSGEEKRKDLDSDASETPDLEKSLDGEGRFLLTREAIPELSSLFNMRPESSFAPEVYRALEQARLRVERVAKTKS